jgi:plasmid stabilization system protein ParE
MIFTVVWTPEAEQHLATIWLAAADRNAVNRASNAIDLALAVDPNAVGFLVFDTVREYTHAPLAVEFEVINADCRAVVLTVWETTHGRPDLTGN